MSECAYQQVIQTLPNGQGNKKLEARLLSNSFISAHVRSKSKRIKPKIQKSIQLISHGKHGLHRKKAKEFIFQKCWDGISKAMSFLQRRN